MTHRYHTPEGERIDFVIGQRGGVWYAFHNTVKAIAYVRTAGVPKSDKLYELFERLEKLKFSCVMEEENVD